MVFAVVRIVSTQNCFVDVSKQLYSILTGDQELMNYGEKKLFVQISVGDMRFMSLVRTTVEAKDSESYFVMIDRQICNAYNFKDNQVVDVERLKTPIYPAEVVTMSPILANQWSIIEEKSTMIENDLLNQVSCVEKNMIVPIYLENQTIRLKVVSTEPSGLVFMRNMTELHLVPNLSEESLTNSLPVSLGEKKEKEFSSIDFAFTTLSCFFNVDLEEYILTRPARPNESSVTYKPTPEVKHIFIDTNIIGIPGISKVLTSDFQQAISKLSDKKIIEISNFSHDTTVVNGISCDDNNIIHPKNKPIEIYFNHVKKLFDNTSTKRKNSFINESKTENESGPSVLPLAPYHVIISDRYFKDSKSYCCAVKKNFICEIEVVGDKMNEGNEKENIQVLVTIFSSKQWEKYFPAISYNFLIVHPILMEQLQIKNNARVKIKCTHSETPSPKAIVLHTSQNDGISNDEMKDIFFGYLRNICSFWDKMIMNQGTLLHFQINSKFYFCVVEMMGIENNITALINNTNLDDICIAIENDENEDVISNLEEKEQVFLDLSEFAIQDNVNEVIIELKKMISRQKLLLSNKTFANRIPTLHKGHVILVHGSSRATSSGCGKSLLCRLVSKYFKDSPYFFHVEYIDCSDYRGKKIETIRDKWIQFVENALNNQPALIVFDDLCELISTVDLIEDGSGKNIYCLRLVDVFNEVIRNLQNELHQVNVIVTASSLEQLHEALLPQSNNFVFTHLNEIDGKIDIVNYLHEMKRLCHKGSWDDDKALLHKLSGFSLRDLTTVTMKTIKGYISGLKRNSNVDVLDMSLMTYLWKQVDEHNSTSLQNATLNKPKEVRWSHIGGLSNVKKILNEIFVWPARYPELFSKCPIRLPTGVLLYGPPGVGKSILGSVVAYESQLNFISVKGPELLSKYVGSSETNVRDLFARAQASKPCLVFFDELDSLAPRRGHDNTGVTDRVVNQLLTQLDGVEGLSGVYILGATSRPDLIDPALLRPGRFDKIVHCDMPTLDARLEILSILLSDNDIGDDVDVRMIAEETDNFSGADLKALVVNAKIESVRETFSYHHEHSDVEHKETKVTIQKKHFRKALDKTSPSLSIEDRMMYQTIFDNFQWSRTKNNEKSITVDHRSEKVTFA